MQMEHGMVTTSFPNFAAAALYILFGAVVLTIVIWLHQRQRHEH